ncbi:protein FAM83B-like [Osmerus eperlanus]|uniref:protein FAM83B-like n=1 Tax=Osmerus eperlanus TaxID=29151 RepID=UPI002E127359
MESSLSCLSSLKEEVTAGEFIQPHYKESYRLAIYALVNSGRNAYQEYLKAENIFDFLSEEELLFIQENAMLPAPDDDLEVNNETEEKSPSTYFPTESDEEVPDLELGWPEINHENTETNISLIFNPPRQSSPTIKEVIRKQIQEARQVIAIAMDVFTDVDIFKELISATFRGVVVYILLDDIQFKSFHTMAERSGVCIKDLKNVRVRTVKGQQYQCRSGAKFNGALEQKFILVDCRTVLYGTYSFMWSYEKINLSMVLVITGQLVGSYDEEFRRLFARSTLPAALSQESVFLREPVSVYNPNSSHTSLHLIHMRYRTQTTGLSTFMGQHKDERYDGPMLTRGLSMQDRLHHSHHTESGQLLRGHSYTGELQKGNSTTQLRTRDIGAYCVPQRQRPNQCSSNDAQTGKMNQLLHTQRTCYSTDKYVLPFNSETSLNRWKIDSYLNNSDHTLAESIESLHHTDTLPEINRNPIPPSRMKSSLIFNSYLQERLKSPIHMCEDTQMLPHSIQSVSADKQPQLPTPIRWMDNQTRMEQLRLENKNYLHQQRDFATNNHISGQSQESLKSAFSAVERHIEKPTVNILEKSYSINELENSSAHSFKPEPSSHGHGFTSGDQPDDQNRLIETERNQKFTTDLTESHRSISHYDIKTISEKRHPESLDWHQPPTRTTSTTDLGILMTKPSLKSSNFRPTCLNVQDSRIMMSLIGIPEEKEGHVSGSIVTSNQLGSYSSLVSLADDRGMSVKEDKPLHVMNSIRSKTAEESQHIKAERVVMVEKAIPEQDNPLQRKNSMRLKLSAIFRSDEQSKEEPTVQRKNSMRSGTSSGSKHGMVLADSDKEQQNCSDSRAKLFSNPIGNSNVDQDSLGSRITLPDPIRKKAYSRFEHFLSVEKRPSEHPMPNNREVPSSEKNKNTFLSGSGQGSVSAAGNYTNYQTQTSTENKFGRFMQRVGNLISKNK